jgi:hypothetical protein
VEGYAGPVAKPRDPKLAVGADNPTGPQLVPAPLADPGKLVVWSASGAKALATTDEDADEPHGKSGKHNAKGKTHHNASAKAQDDSGDDSSDAPASKAKPQKHGPGKAKHHSSRSAAEAHASRLAEAR